MSDLQKMTVIYDYIIRNVYYDHKTLNAAKQNTTLFELILFWVFLLVIW